MESVSKSVVFNGESMKLDKIHIQEISKRILLCAKAESLYSNSRMSKKDGNLIEKLCYKLDKGSLVKFFTDKYFCLLFTLFLKYSQNKIND